MPRTIMGYVLAETGKHQAGLAALAITVFLLSAAPLEFQRRIINDLTEKGSFDNVLWLALGYAGVALADQILKLLLNVYRGWVAENSVRSLRRKLIDADIGSAVAAHSPVDVGVEIAMILEEAEPIGGFVALALSQPLLQVGILVSVVGYMFALQPYLALMGMAFFVPQVVFVPAMQRAINRRASRRILTKREISGTIVEGQNDATQEEVTGIQRIFSLNMAIYWLKYVMYLLMNLMHHLSVAAALCVGGWLVLQGRIEIGTVVAIVGGLAKLNDPWGDLIDWGRELSVVRVKYRLFSEAANWLTGAKPDPTDAGMSRRSAPAEV
ncbi:ABC transporter transmembrane region [Enhydrobacter aerosaccus]|uniref:ABC transporter transmembrane region n=1 Tax=Enhydrobacter aerosaccus TaxID=225324 RepID=A0A1T4R132_9HYPH|nr:ABC transporter ATP-binding protein [Enhydrobacter aerosaccus]SKA09704.1 ABC transporter transmembrane region [Enhydrobacter aerosaccus]